MSGYILPTGGTGSSTLYNSQADYTIYRLGNTYYALQPDGTVALSATDTATTSGLKAVLEGVCPDGTSNITVAFGPGRFHFLDAPLGNEAWANTESGANFVNIRNVTFRGTGMANTILSSRTNTSSASPDESVLLFTNCNNIIVQDMDIEFCGSSITTMEAINCNQGTNNIFERVRFTRSRGTALIFDGGDVMRYSSGNRVINCEFWGRPPTPQVSMLPGGSLNNTLTYKWAVTYTDADLGGAGVAAETRPSAPTPQVVTPSANQKARIYLPLGPYTTQARNVYRYDNTNGWLFITSIADNTTLYWDDDDGTIAGSTASFTTHSNIQQTAVELLGSSDNVVMANIIDGVGDGLTGVNQYGINCVRKASSAIVTADRNRIIGNVVRGTYSRSIRVAGGSDNLIQGNLVLNPGVNATKTQAVRLEGISGATTDRNMVSNNHLIDNRDATDPLGGVGMSNAIIITATNTPTNNGLVYNIIKGNAATAISDSGTTTVGVSTNILG